MGRNRTPSWIVRRAIKRSIQNCTAKTVYKTIAEADAASKKYNQRLYICKVCQQYHLTSKMEGY